MDLHHKKTEQAFVAIIDDDVDFCQSIAATLTTVGYTVLVFNSAQAFLAAPILSEPATLLIDFIMPGMTGLELCREIHARNLPCTFSIISAYADVPFAVDAMKLGAIDLLEKPFGRQRLLEVVSKAVNVARSRSSNRIYEAVLFERLETLTAREREILDGVASGLVTKEIARNLAISTRTVDVHRSRIMQKLGIESPSQLANLLASMKNRSA